jgi:diguanylate cyclase (GGDEF)-like protein
MKQGYRIFLGSLMAVTVLLVGYILLKVESRGLVEPLGWLLMGSAVYMEVMQMFYDDQVSMSFSGPLTILAVATQPFWFVLIMIILFTSSGKLFQKYYYHEQENFLDIKWFFNLTQYIFIAALIRWLFFGIYPASFSGMFSWMMASLLYIVVNVFLVGTMISLYTGNNGFKSYTTATISLFIYYHVTFTLLLMYVQAVGGIFGVLLIMMALMPMQGEILRRSSARKLNPMLIQDELTGAFNRGFMQRKITEWLHHKRPFAVLFIDLDDFKYINDTYGYAVGDQILMHFVSRLKEDLRLEDRVVRYGGDEFCVLFQNAEEAQRVHERWKDIWLKYFLENGAAIQYGFSSGIAEYTCEDEMTFFEFLDKIDQQMYVEKRKKTNRTDQELA